MANHSQTARSLVIILNIFNIIILNIPGSRTTIANVHCVSLTANPNAFFSFMHSRKWIQFDF